MFYWWWQLGISFVVCTFHPHSVLCILLVSAVCVLLMAVFASYYKCYKWMCFCRAGVLCHSTTLGPGYCQFALYIWSWSPYHLWSHGWQRCFPHPCKGETLWILISQASQVFYHGFTVRTPQPGTRQLCVHLQQLQGPGWDSIPLLSVWCEYCSFYSFIDWSNLLKWSVCFLCWEFLT